MTLHPTTYTLTPCSILHPSPCTLRPSPCILHHTLYTLQPTPYTLHPTPYTLHPTPYTLHPTSYTLHVPIPCPEAAVGRGSQRVRILWGQGWVRRRTSNPSKKCSYKRSTRDTVCGTMRIMCGADAGHSAMDYQSLWGEGFGICDGLGFKGPRPSAVAASACASCGVRVQGLWFTFEDLRLRI